VLGIGKEGPRTSLYDEATEDIETDLDDLRLVKCFQVFIAKTRVSVKNLTDCKVGNTPGKE
jgi:hypothetical protein